MDDVKSSFDLSKTVCEPEKKRSRTEKKNSTAVVDENGSSSPAVKLDEVKPMEVDDMTGTNKEVNAKKADKKKSVTTDVNSTIDWEETSGAKNSEDTGALKSVEKEDAGAKDATDDFSRGVQSVEEQAKRIMEDPQKRMLFSHVPQKDVHYARLISFNPPTNIAILDKVPLICGRERLPDTDCNFLEIGDVTLHKRAVSRKHFSITYDDTVQMFFIEVSSRNGIILDGVDLRDGKHPLRSGASISVQHFTMYFDIPPDFIPPSTYYRSGHKI